MKHLSRILPVFAVAAVFATQAAAQGSDSCSTPQAIAGTGTFSFITGTTGTEGQANALCNQFGQPVIANDVWYAWTAPSTGSFTLSACGGTSIDTKFALYAGSGCPAGGPLVCNDDFCGLQSQGVFAPTSGSVYTIQFGVFPGTAGGSGTFTIAQIGATCPSSTGPDVIVGGITGPSNYAAAGGIDALSLGSDACNIGSAVVQWTAGNNLHPVFGGTAYRYKVVNGAGRFEQVGRSWLRHGSLALANELCCTCTNPGTGALLGIGCANFDTAAGNGTQSGLGPRWQVNANTGVFTFPPANPAFAGSTARRLEIATSDLEATGAGTRYFGECMYVTQDDAAAGNQNNNASYRELTVSGTTDFTFGFTGATQISIPAIGAWQVVDPTVTLTNVQVAGDGLFIIGSKATSLGGGIYHYEYAVYNQNSDRNGGSFSVPIPAGASISNIGFRDG
ncbi:MAG: hypothetical protein NTY35_14680, partial [Planctomycetota bacterium]|nr:hypothetical protein [Planctomycetota bacterium]